jgi:hypothetical protein
LTVVERRLVRSGALRQAFQELGLGTETARRVHARAWSAELRSQLIGEKVRWAAKTEAPDVGAKPGLGYG